MLSRTAENLYWLGRYVERAESTARLIEMGRRMTMTRRSPGQDEWRSVVQAAGALDWEDAPEEPVTEIDAVTQLLLSDENPSSIRMSLAHARDNGKAVRSSLTQEMWEALNDGWRRLETTSRQTACRDLPHHLEWVKQRCATFRGSVETGQLRNDRHDFLRLGGHIERADMVLRLLDVKYYVLLPETDVVGGGRDHLQWTSVLHANSAIRAYHHLYLGDYSPWNIVDFLLLNQQFPRSLAYNHIRIGEHLGNLARLYGERRACHRISSEMIARLSDTAIGEVFQQGLHEFITDSVRTNARLSNEIAAAYHF